MNLAKFSRRGYVSTPTPIEALPSFSRALGGKVNIFIKRDDLLPGCAGGNKTRKLDFCIADAIDNNADTIITCGAVQSNHCRLTLSWAVKEGLDCHLVLEERVKGSYSPDASGNNFLFHLMGVKSITVVPGGSNMMDEMQKVASGLKAEGKTPTSSSAEPPTPLAQPVMSPAPRKPCSNSSTWASKSITWLFPVGPPEHMRASSSACRAPTPAFPFPE